MEVLYFWLFTGTSRAVNLERRFDHDDHPGSLPSSGGVTPPVFVPNGVTTSSWCHRDGGANGNDRFLCHVSELLAECNHLFEDSLFHSSVVIY
jgi:hypothetical protein